jgi:hypothetical protein
MTLTLTEHRSGAKHLHLTGCKHLRHPLYRNTVIGTYADEYEAEKRYEINNDMGTHIEKCVPMELRIGAKQECGHHMHFCHDCEGDNRTCGCRGDENDAL